MSRETCPTCRDDYGWVEILPPSDDPPEHSTWAHCPHNNTVLLDIRRRAKDDQAARRAVRVAFARAAERNRALIRPKQHEPTPAPAPRSFSEPLAQRDDAEAPSCDKCSAELTHPESVDRGRCAECQLDDGVAP